MASLLKLFMIVCVTFTLLHAMHMQLVVSLILMKRVSCGTGPSILLTLDSHCTKGAWRKKSRQSVGSGQQGSGAEDFSNVFRLTFDWVTLKVRQNRQSCPIVSSH